jgi:translation elongation factor P/translation initiation factor 5A
VSTSGGAADRRERDGTAAPLDFADWRLRAARGAPHTVHLACARQPRGAASKETYAGMATTNDLKNGMTLNLDGQLWNVIEFQHVKPGKGGAFVRTTLKNVLSGKVVDKTFNAGTKVETANVDKRGMSYLYREGEDFVFMDSETYDQIHVPFGTVAENANYLLENAEVTRCTTGRPCTSSFPPASS